VTGQTELGGSRSEWPCSVIVIAFQAQDNHADHVHETVRRKGHDGELSTSWLINATGRLRKLPVSWLNLSVQLDEILSSKVKLLV